MSDGVPLLTRRTLMQSGVAGLAVVYGLSGCGDDEETGERQRRRREGVRHRHVRLELLGSRPQGRAPGGLRRVRDLVGHHGRRQHGRPQHVPGADQQLPPGHARRRVHLVRRLPHAVLRPARPGDRHQRRLGEDRRQLLRRVQAGLDGPRRQAVLHPVLQLPVGDLLQEERLGEERLRAGREPRRLQGALRADQEGRHDADRVRRQGRLAGDGHVRLHQHAHQRLRLPQVR